MTGDTKATPGSFEAARALAVLEDCRSALVDLRRNPQGVIWRLRWCTALTLLRAVGHVLHKEGLAPTAPPEFQKAISEWWKQLIIRKPEPAIFWQFIEKDRNALLKEYRFTAEQGLSPSPRPVDILDHFPPGGAPIAEPTYLMKDGPFAGKDQRIVVAEAIDWWQVQLDEINLHAVAALLANRL